MAKQDKYAYASAAKSGSKSDDYAFSTAKGSTASPYGFRWTGDSTFPQNPNTEPPADAGYGGGYGYGGGSSGPSEQTKKLAALQTPLAAESAKISLDNLKDMGDVYGGADKFTENAAAAQKANLLRATTSEWFPSLVRTQAAFKAQTKKMGNGKLSSGMKDSVKDTWKAYDINQGSILNNLMANLNDITIDEYNTKQRNRNALNELKVQTKQSLRNQGVELQANMANLDPGFVNGDEDGWLKTVTPSDKGKGGSYDSSIEQTLKMFGISNRLKELDLDEPYDVQRLMGTVVYPSNMQRSLKKGDYNSSQAANRSYWQRENR